MVSPVAAVVVAYRSGACLERCLDSLAGRVAEVAVVDNCPQERSWRGVRRRYPSAVWIDNERNLGFAAACNQGIAATRSPFVLLMNPDCELLEGLEHLVRACQEAGVAGAGGVLVEPDGRPQTGFFARSLPTPAALALEAVGANRLWPRNPVNRRYRMLDMRLGEDCDVGQPAGAFLLLRRVCLASIGGFDEAFRPVWFEDVDLCKRLSDEGYRLRHIPAAAARHEGGHSVATLGEGHRLAGWYGGLLRYARKHFPRGAAIGVRAAVVAGLGLRAASWWRPFGSNERASAHLAMLLRVLRGYPGRCDAGVCAEPRIARP